MDAGFIGIPVHKRDNWLKKVVSSTLIFKVFLFNTTRLYCLQNLETIARMFWKKLDVHNMESYCRFLSLKVPRWQSYWFYFKALNRLDSYNLVMVNCLHGHGMTQSVICFLWLTGPSLHLWRFLMGIRGMSSYYFMQQRLSTSWFYLIIQSWPCPWRCHVDIVGVQAFYTRGHSHEKDRHLRTTKISPQFSETVIIPTAHHEFGAK